MNNLKPKNLLLQFVQGKSYIDRTKYPTGFPPKINLRGDKSGNSLLT
jgi:hypothetical protein